MLTSLLLCAALAAAKPTTDVRFEYEEGRVYVPVSAVVHGHAVPLGWFILDTGASPVCIDAAVARRIGLAVKPMASQTGAGSGSSPAGLADGLPLRVDTVALAPASVVVVPLDSLLSPYMGRPVAGIIGAQFFHEHAVELDRGRNLLRVDPPGVEGGADLPRAGRHAIPFAMQDDTPLIVATLAVPGADSALTSLRLMVDLGAKAPLLLTGPLLERLGGEARLGPHVLASLGAGAGGETQYYFTGVRALTLGPEEVEVADSLVAGFSAFGTLRSTDYDGLLGAPLLDHFVVLFDYARHLMWISPRGNGRAAPEALTAFDRAGLFLVARGTHGEQHVMVRRVVKGSPAAEAGIVEGDELTSLDGRAASSLRLSTIRSVLKASLTPPVRVGIRHGGASAVCVLQLRNLLL